MLEELKNTLEKDENYDNFQDFINDGYGEETFGDFTLKHEDGYGGEDMGSEYWVVFSATKDGQTRYFKLEGWYASYEGSTFDDYFAFNEVEKAQKMIDYWKDV
jgi:hypothetical protein